MATQSIAFSTNKLLILNTLILVIIIFFGCCLSTTGHELNLGQPLTPPAPPQQGQFLNQLMKIDNLNRTLLNNANSSTSEASSSKELFPSAQNETKLTTDLPNDHHQVAKDDGAQVVSASVAQEPSVEMPATQIPKQQQQPSEETRHSSTEQFSSTSVTYASDDDTIIESSHTTAPSANPTQHAATTPFVRDPSPKKVTAEYYNGSTTTTASTPTDHLSHRMHTEVHPILIYSIRYEIKSYDLFNSLYAQRAAANQFYTTTFPVTAAASTYPNIHINTHQIGGNTATSFTPELQTQLTNVPSQQTTLSKPSKTLMAGLKNTISLDFYYSEDSESYIFWADVNEEKIYKGTFVNNSIANVDVIVQTGLASAEGLAVDWIGKNIYWVESTLDLIEVANMNGTFRRTIIAGDMDSPRAITVDPRYGLLFWTDWDKKVPRIESATMSGEDRKTLVKIKDVNGGWPNGITLDYDLLKIYWIDANSDSIHVVNYDGSNHQTLMKSGKLLGHPFSITLFDNNLYWTDWKTNSISMSNKQNSTDARILQTLSSRLFDIKVFHPNRQPKINQELNPCHHNNGFCSHLCLLSVNNTRRCECPRLMKLAPDDKTCIDSEKVLLVGRTNEIRALDADNTLYHLMAPITLPKVFNPKQLEFYAKTKSIYWVDSQSNEIKRAQLTDTTIDTIIDVIIESPSGLALDWISGNLYVTSAAPYKSHGKIFISNLEGEYISVLMDNSSGLVNPKSIVVHPTIGLMFCIDEGLMHNTETVIFMARMDGQDKKVIASKLLDDKFDNPSNLAIDFETSRVYWVNQGQNASIQFYDISKNQIITLLDESEIPSSVKINPSLLCVDGDHLIVSAHTPIETIVKISKYDATDRVTMRTQNIDQLTSLRVYNSSIQSGTNACSFNNGNCSQLCIPIDSKRRICKCTTGFTNNPLNETECIGKNKFLIYSYNSGMKGISIEPNSMPENYYLPPIHKAFRASSIDFVHKEKLIYWVDNEEGCITRINCDTTNYKTIVQNLESEESISIDWLAGNIYWLDPYYDIIEVGRLDGSSRYVIVSGDMEKPNGIVINPLKGYIAWSDVGSFPRIETAQLDGNSRKIIADTNLTHIDDLAIDYVDDFIYWVDSSYGIVERIKPDGTNRQVVYSNSSASSHLVSIAIYEEYLYIADSAYNHGYIFRVSKNSLNTKFESIIQENLGEGLRDIAIFAEQPSMSSSNNPCILNNGGCQDLCLFLGRPGKRRCICSHGRLSDGLLCKPYDTFVLFSKLSQIDSLHIVENESSNNSPYVPITMENRSTIISLTVDYSSRRVIYSDITRDQISSIYFNGTDRRILVEKQSSVEGIAFVNNQLYWTSIHDNSILRLNITSFGSCLNNTSCKKVLPEKIVNLSSDDKPRGIAIDMCTSYVYWTNWNTNASIQRASPHSGYKVESIIRTSIKIPNGIAIDQNARKLYWCDARLDKIEACDMDGTNRIVLVSALPQHPFALAIWDNYVFWTDWLARGVFKADKYTGQNPVLIKKVVQRPMGIAVAAPEVIECPADPCFNNGGCPTGTICASHHLGIPECRANHELSHDLIMPSTKCKHSRGNSACDTVAYHDIILNAMDRYNMTDLMPIEKFISTKVGFDETPTSSSIESNLGGVYPPPRNSDSKSTQQIFPVNRRPTIAVSTQSTFPKVVHRTEQTLQRANMTTDRVQTVLPDTNLKRKTSITEIPQKYTTEQPKIEQTTRVPTTDTTKTTTMNPTSFPKSTLSPVPSSNVTLAPCQIIPAALQPTTIDSSPDDCNSITQYKCHVSPGLSCIPIEARCDGHSDCPKGEDETNCYLSGRSHYNLPYERDSYWHRVFTVILVIFAAVVTALFLVFGTKGRRRWFVGANGAFNHRRMFDDNGTNIEISNPMFDEDDSRSLVNCAFSIDLNERTTNFSNPLYERQVLLMNDKHMSSK